MGARWYGMAQSVKCLLPKPEDLIKFRLPEAT